MIDSQFLFFFIRLCGRILDKGDKNLQIDKSNRASHDKWPIISDHYFAEMNSPTLTFFRYYLTLTKKKSFGLIEFEGMEKKSDEKLKLVFGWDFTKWILT